MKRIVFTYLLVLVMSNASAESLEVDGFVFHHPGSKWDEFKIVGTDQFVFFKYKPTEGYVGQINVWYPKNDRVTFRDLKVFFQQDLKKDKRFKNIEGHIWDEPYGEMECYRYNESYENHDKSRKGIISIAKSGYICDHTLRNIYVHFYVTHMKDKDEIVVKYAGGIASSFLSAIRLNAK